MKKRVILLSLALCIGVMGFAQQRVNTLGKNAPKNSITAKHEINAMGNEILPILSFEPQTSMVAAESMVKADDYADWKTMDTKYDLQTNQAIGNRVYQWPNGDVAVTATWGVTDPVNWSDRGTGYNFYTATAGSFNAKPTSRIENAKTGWPTITGVGANGEMVVSHTGSGLIYYTRATKGTGAWNGPYQINNPLEDGLTGLVGTPELTWARIASSGDNNQYVHLVAATQELGEVDTAYYLFYKRGIYQADTIAWDPAQVITEATLTNPDGSIYERSFFTADSYCLAANGNHVSILLIDSWSDIILKESSDNGATWTSSVVWEFPIIGDDYLSLSQIWPTMTDTLDTIWVPNGEASITIDNQGETHLVFTIALVRPIPANYYTYWLGLGVDGVVYWNTTMPKISDPEGHEAGTALDPYDYDAYITQTGDTVIDMYGLFYRPNTEAHLVGGYAIDDPSYPGVGTWEGEFDNDGLEIYYGHKGNSDYPAITIDANGNIVVSFSSVSVCRTSNGSYLRNCYVSYYSATDDYWYYNRYNLSEDWTHQMDEVWYVTSAPFSHNGDFWTLYNMDYQIGNFLNSSNDGYENPQESITTNTLYAVRIRPTAGESVNVAEQESPITAVEIAPNPIEGSNINVMINASFESEATISIYNLAGQMVYTSSVDALTVGMNQRTISVDLTSGVYFCTVSAANGFQETKKVVVR